jgi:pyruvate kinase
MSNDRRRTKILATLGPATDAPGVLDAILNAGVDVVRLNFSHGDPSGQVARAQALREAAHRAGREVGILVDLPGPKIRIERFAEAACNSKPATASTWSLPTPHRPARPAKSASAIWACLAM